MKSYLEKNSYPVKKFLTACISSLITGLVCTSVVASDIDIYQNATAGDTTLMFMLDISGSMSTYNSTGNRREKGYACDLPKGVTESSYSQKTEAAIKGGPEYRRQWCVGGGKLYYDRITRLKDGMMDLLYGNPGLGITPLGGDKVIGLSTLGAYYGSSHRETGAVLVPARRLDAKVGDQTQRQILIDEIGSFNNFTNTPTARSYAETVAYLMGTTTEVKVSRPYYFIYNSHYVTYNYRCASWTGDYTSCLSWEYVSTFQVDTSNMTSTSCSKIISNSNQPGTCYTQNNYFVNSSESGFQYSKQETKEAPSYIKYAAPSSLNQTVNGKQCSGQGIYVLTDGEPTQDDNAQALMKAALGGALGADFSCDNSSWDCTHKLAATILNEAKNPKNLKFKTAVVGFGNSFNGISSFDRKLTQQQNIDNINRSNANADIKNAAIWGVTAEGGWYSGNSSEDVVNSVNSFLGDLGKEIPAVTTGTPEIPVDALIPSALQNYAYYPQFQPTPASASQIWLGNVKKYKVSTTGTLVDKFGRLIADNQGRLLQTVANQLATPIEIFDLWSPNATSTPTDSERENALIGGTKLQLQLDQANSKERKILSTRNFSTKQATNTLQQFSTDNLSSMSLKGTDKAASLLELLGYQLKSSYVNTANITKENLDKTTGIRFGAVMHSTPLLLTNEGQVTSESNTLSSKNRKDYILFGTTQGVLHVVNAETGVEKFAFVPNEMIENQHLAFGSPDIPFLGKDRLFYGVDGQWTAYTEYVLDKDSTYSDNKLTVGLGKNDAVGKQLVYGGLRMGGRDYYALDLSNIDDPKLKFKITPSGTCSAENPLGCMGQSWSKPTITHVNWKGKKTLVMLVGGGYDAGGIDGNANYLEDGVVKKGNYAGYENEAYEQNNKRGAGVYMFDASTGNLLWWSSANVTENSDASTTNYAATSATDMKFSVVSQIKAVDRNSDGLSDHLYFGDLGGQVWRVDLNNDVAVATDKFAKAPVKLFSLGGTGQSRKRFYDAPAFSTYANGNTIFGVVSIGSGNRSLPLKDYTVGTPGVSYDGVYNIYDKDVARTDLYDLVNKSTTSNVQVYKYVPTDKLQTQTLLTTVGVTLQPKTTVGITADSAKMLINIDNSNRLGVTPPANSYGDTQGWYYLFESNKLQSEKVFATPIVINNDLYVTTFDASRPGSSGACGAGVKGESYITLFCMPYGQCKAAGSTDNYRLNLGVGIVGGALGAGDVEGMIRRIVATRDTTGLDDNEILKREYQTGNRLVSQRWYVK